MSAPLPEVADVEAAALRLDGIVRQTPLLESDALNELVGGRLLCKAECLQRTGSFKLRGAYNAISQLDGQPVVAFSSGNHAQGVAAAAKLLGVPATIVMPADAPAIKIANTRALGAEIRLYDREREVREEIGAEIALRTGAALVKPYDDPRIIAGQGTVGLEAAAQLRAIGTTPDAALLPCGGGGLIAGCSIALAAAFPGVAIYAVEPEGFDDTGRSLAAGERLANAPGANSFCDALLAPVPGELTFALQSAPSRRRPRGQRCRGRARDGPGVQPSQGGGRARRRGSPRGRARQAASMRAAAPSWWCCRAAMSIPGCLPGCCRPERRARGRGGVRPRRQDSAGRAAGPPAASPWRPARSARR